MRVLVLASAWKGSFSARAAERAMERGVRAALDHVDVASVRVADGGDGTAQVLAQRFEAVARRARVRDALGALHLAPWYCAREATAVLDLASACGMRLLHARALSPLAASSRGLGELLRAALDGGARTIWVGLGGSASTDAGAGAAAALGARFLDGRGRELPDGGAALQRLACVDRARIDPRIAQTRILLLCDVRAPLLGAAGAARVFGPQKGARPAQVRALEAGLGRFAHVVFGSDTARLARAECGGAAGGAGAGLGALLGARLLPGAATLADLIRLDSLLPEVDALVCGEGRYDGALHAGKVNDEIVRRAQRAGKPVAVVCGSMSARAGAQAGVTVCAAGRRIGDDDIARLTRRAIRAMLRAGQPEEGGSV